MAEKTARLESLQCLRFFAAGLVVWAHFGGLLGGVAGISLPNPAIGGIGVDLFFVLSGFVIALSATKLGGDHRTFFAHRLARVVPLYYLCTILIVALGGKHHGPWDQFQLLWNSFLFLPLFDQGQFHGTIHAYGWTLSFEVWFYLLFGTGLWLLRSNVPRTILWVSGLLILGAALPAYPGTWELPRYLLHPLVLEFCGGMLLFLLRDRLPRAMRWIFFAGAAVAGWAVGHTPELGPHLLVLDDRGLGLERAAIWGGFAVCVVGCLVLLEQERTLQPPRWLVRLGDASYAIYLFQPLATHAAMTWLPNRGVEEGALFAILAFGGGTALHFAIERPLLRRARHFAERCFGVRKLPGG